MSIVKKSNPHDLTEDEIQFLKSASVPMEVKQYLARQQQNIGTKVNFYRKVAAAARAEADAILAIRDLDAARGEVAQLQQARQAIEGQQRRIKALEGELVRKDAEVLAITATSAMVVHSDD